METYSNNYKKQTGGFISYAQNAEDVILNRVFASKKKGFYIDVGAADPIRDSVTKAFYERGWNGINIEPQSHHYKDLLKQRPRDTNLQIGLSNKKSELTFYECIDTDGWSTFSKAVMEEHKKNGVKFKEVTIPVDTLKDVCALHNVPEIDFLKIDVEGYEKYVLEGGDWKKFRPVVILLEAHEYKSWEKQLLNDGYIHALDDGLNRFYVRKESKELLPILSKPANVLDNYAPYFYLQLIDKLQLENGEAHQAFAKEYKLLDSELKKTLQEYDILTKAHTKKVQDLESTNKQLEEVTARLTSVESKLQKMTTYRLYSLMKRIFKSK